MKVLISMGRNHAWPIFKAKLFINEEVEVIYEKPLKTNYECYRVYSKALESLGDLIDIVLKNFFQSTNLTQIQRLSDNSNISRGYVDVVYKTRKGLNTLEPFTINAYCFVADSYLYFHIFDMGRRYPYPPFLLDPANKVLNLENAGNDLKQQFMYALDKLLQVLCEWKSNKFLSLPFELKAQILKNVDSMTDFRNICLSCQNMSGFLKDNHVLRTLFHRTFKCYPKTQEIYNEFKSLYPKVTPPRPSVVGRPRHFLQPIPDIPPHIRSRPDFRPPYNFPGMIGGPRDMYPYDLQYIDPTRFSPEGYSPYYPDPLRPPPSNPDSFQAWDPHFFDTSQIDPYSFPRRLDGPRRSRHSHPDWM
ncbi:hypothetical protein RF11_07507 [Thelohanellus kitauei]|uniref:F-box domain-containing protein n=1 Tax=Thelohanellus kitauei TaxID=669202 RepID=A0A0C2M3I9_THEKT|nr:hypothetical protein RF11_07507 [Thelohanellus kitauei]